VLAGEGTQRAGGAKNQARAKRKVKKATRYTLPSTSTGDIKSDADKARAKRYQKTKAFSKQVQDASRAASPAQRSKAVSAAEKTAAGKRSDAQRAILSLAKQLGSEARDTKSNADRARAAAYKKTDAFFKISGESAYNTARKKTGEGSALPLASLPTVNPAKIVDKEFLKTGIKSGTKATATAAKALDQLNRPTKSVVAAVDKVASGKPGEAPSAALRALKTNKGPMTGDVLRKHGVPAAVAGVAGFVGDVALDPTTYVSFGTASVAKKAATSAAEKAAAEAIARGLTKEEAKKIGERKAKAVLLSAAKKGKDNKGLQVTIGGRIPLSNKVVAHTTSGKTTAALARATGISKAAKRIRNSNVVQKAGEDFVNDFRPAYFSEDQFKTVRNALRNYRSETHQGQQRAVRRAAAISSEQKKLAAKGSIQKGKSGSKELIREIETQKDFNKLSPAAQDLVRLNAKIYKAERNAGLRAKPYTQTADSDPVRYFPHVKKKENALRKLTSNTTPAVGSGAPLKVSIDKQRKISGTLEKKAEKRNFQTDASKAIASRESVSAEALAKQKMIHAVASVGRTIRAGDKVKLHDGESLYKLEPGGLTKLSKRDVPKVENGGSVPGHIVALDDRIVEYTKNRIGPAFKERSAAGRTWDKANAKWKTVAMATPGFHMRNLFGDSTQSLALAGTSARDVGTSVRALKASHAVHKSEMKNIPGDLSPKAIKLSGKVVKVGKEKLTLKQLHDEAVKNGAIDSGFAVKEIEQLSGSTGKMSSLRRASQARENLFRLSTYINGRRRGLDPAAAADFANKHHFDYGDLTKVERGARRAVPFYTFAARNARLQAGKLVKEPGKISRVPKALEEAARAQGYESYDQFVSSLPEQDQQGIPIPVGKGKSGKAAFVQLPQQDLRRLSTNPKDQIRDAALMVSPLIKTPIELGINYSTFYNNKISDPNRPFSPAPSWVKDLPAPIKKQLGVSMYNDKRRGKILGWKPSADYVARSFGPHASAAIDMFSPPKNGRGLDKTGRLTSLVGGVKLTNVSDRVLDRKIIDASSNLAKLDEKRAKLKAQGKDRNGKYYTKEYEQLLDQMKKLRKTRDKLKTLRGDAVESSKDRAKRHNSSSGSGSAYGSSAYGGGY